MKILKNIIWKDFVMRKTKMIKNFSIYIIAVIEILLLGFIYEHLKNVSLGNLFYFGVPLLLYVFLYFGEKAFDKVIIYLCFKGKRNKVLLFSFFGFLFGMFGEFLKITLITSIGGVIMFVSLVMFFLWGSVCKEAREDLNKNENTMQ